MAYFVEETDYLEHYGRKGMKWYQHIFTDIQTETATGRSAAASANQLGQQRWALEKKGPLSRILNRKKITNLLDAEDKMLDLVFETRDAGSKKISQLLDETKKNDKKARAVIEKLLDNPDTWWHYDLSYEGKELGDRLKERVGEKTYETKHKRAIQSAIAHRGAEALNKMNQQKR